MQHQKKHFLETPVYRPVGTLMLLAVLIVIGSIAYQKLPTNLMPDIVYPMVRVQLKAGQTPPDILLNTVTRVLEQQLAQAEGVELIESSTTQGQVQISLSFDYTRDVDIALRDVASLVDRAKPQLPAHIEAPVIFKFDPQNLPVLELIMTSATMDITALREFADNDLLYRFAGVEGVSIVRPSGGKVREIQVVTSPEKLLHYKLTLAELSSVLSAENTQQAVGRVDLAGREYFALSQGIAGSIEELSNLRIPLPDGELIRLREIADIRDTHQEQRIIITVNGEEGVKMSFFKNPQANSVEVSQRIMQHLEQMQRKGSLPADLDIAVTSNESTYIVDSIHSAQHALLLAIALVALIVLFFLKDWRFTLISMAVLPVALLATLFLMNAFGLSINLMSIGGLIVGVSLMIDYGIVYIENITRHYLQTRKVKTSIRLASYEVASPLTTSLIALLSVLVPFLFFGGLSLLFFREFILVVMFATVSGLLVAFILIPTLYSFIGAKALDHSRHEGLQMAGLVQLHTRVLTFAMDHRFATVGLLILSLMVTFLLSGQLGSTFLPQIDDGRITLQLQAEPGTQLSDMQGQIERLETMLLEKQEVKLVDVTAGGRIGQTIQETPAEAEILVELVAKSARSKSVDEYMKELADDIDRLELVGTKVKVKKARIRAIRTFSGTASSGDFDVVINIGGQDPQVLSAIGDQVRNILRPIEGLADVRSTLIINQPTLTFDINEENAAAFRVSSQRIGQSLSTAITGALPSRYLEKGEYYDIRLLLDRSWVYNNMNGLKALPIGRLSNGDALLLSQVAEVRLAKGPLSIDRVNQSTVNMINGNARGRTIGEVAVDVRASLDTLSLPAGYTINYGGRMAALEGSDSSLLWVGLFGMLLLFVVLAVQYEGLLIPFVIILVLPVGLLGSITGLYLTGMPLSSTALIGFLLVIGIATNNALVLVAFIEQLRKEGMPLQEAVRVGTSLRIQPKIMTALIAMAGMVPLAIGRDQGGEILQPLAIVILCGMPIALLATLVLLPTLYLLSQDRPSAK